MVGSSPGSPAPKKRLGRRTYLTLLLILGVSLALNIVVAAKASLTADEGQHLRYGKLVLQGQPDRVAYGLYDSNMPSTALNAAGLAVAEYFSHMFWHHALSAHTEVFVARIPTVLASVGLCLLVFYWALTCTEKRQVWPRAFCVRFRQI
jgi:hypothetical protein